LKRPKEFKKPFGSIFSRRSIIAFLFLEGKEIKFLKKFATNYKICLVMSVPPPANNCYH